MDRAYNVSEVHYFLRNELAHIWAWREASFVHKWQYGENMSNVFLRSSREDDDVLETHQSELPFAWW